MRSAPRSSASRGSGWTTFRSAPPLWWWERLSSWSACSSLPPAIGAWSGRGFSIAPIAFCPHRKPRSIRGRCVRTSFASTHSTFRRKEGSAVAGPFRREIMSSDRFWMSKSCAGFEATPRSPGPVSVTLSIAREVRSAWSRRCAFESASESSSHPIRMTVGALSTAGCQSTQSGNFAHPRCRFGREILPLG